MNDMIQSETYIYKSVGDCDIKADVYQVFKTSSRSPVLVHIHGGCLMYGSRGLNGIQLGKYLDAGYTVVTIDYRLAPETLIPDIITDIQDAFVWVREQGPELFNADPDRIAAAGHSAGGYLALMSGCCVIPRPKAIVSFYGYGDIIADWYSKPDLFYRRQPAVTREESGIDIKGKTICQPYRGRGKDKLYLYCRQNGLWPITVSGVDPVEDPDYFIPFCPERSIEDDYPPTIFLHGDQDTDVPFRQSVDMANALSEKGLTYKLVIMKGYGHGFDESMDDPKVANAFDAVLSFLAKHL